MVRVHNQDITGGIAELGWPAKDLRLRKILDTFILGITEPHKDSVTITRAIVANLDG
jgi:hypothetical protein